MSRKYNLLVKECHEMVIFGMGVSKMPFLYQGHENVIFGTGTYFGVEWIKLLLQGSSFGHFWNGVQVLAIFI